MDRRRRDLVPARAGRSAELPATSRTLARHSRATSGGTARHDGTGPETALTWTPALWITPALRMSNRKYFLAAAANIRVQLTELIVCAAASGSSLRRRKAISRARRRAPT